MITGPSHVERNRSGPKQRSVNLLPTKLEASGEPVSSSFKDWPGLVEFADIGAPIRGAINSNGRILVVAGSSLLELASDGTTTSRGSIGSSSGWVEFSAIQGQIALTDSTSLYVLDRATNALTSTTGYPGGPRIDALNEFLFMVDDTTGQFWWSDVGDATNIDGLSFATAESAPDNLTSCIVANEELLLIGKSNIEPWRVVGGDDVVLKCGPVIPIGSESPYSVRRLDNSVFFVGSSEEFGQGVVYRLSGYTPQRVSTRAEEEMLSGIDLSGAYAYTSLMDGEALYCLQVPELDTTLVYSVKTGLWSEAAELVNGVFTKHRGNVHLFAFNKHYLGSDDGILYEWTPEASDNAGDVLCRDRVMPEFRRKDGKLIRFPELRVICDTGAGGTMMVRWSDDSGNSWSDWEYIGLGEIGNFDRRVQLHAMGSADRRTYQFRVTDNVPWNPSELYVRTA